MTRKSQAHDLERCVGWAKPTGRANARPMASPPRQPRMQMVGTARSAPLPTLGFSYGGLYQVQRPRCRNASFAAIAVENVGNGLLTIS